MMIFETAAALIRLSLIAALMIAIVLLVRRPLRALAGPALAYALWLVVPVTMLAAALPNMLPPAPPIDITQGVAVFQIGPFTPPPMERVDLWTGVALALWAAGCAAMAAWSVVVQHRYVRGLGPLTPSGEADIVHGATPDAGPALVGVWHPLVVLPSDFDTRFSAQERALIIAHERAHARRADPFANAVLALLQCLFWFHPLVHLAARRFRFDQELACDAAVMRAHTGARRSYAAAMLKTATGTPAASLVHSCHWQSTHPLKERIMSLQQTPPRRARRLAGRLAVAALVCFSGYAALGARADNLPLSASPMYAVQLTIDSNGRVTKPLIHSRANETFRISDANDQHRWDGEFLLQRLANGTVQINSTIKYDGVTLSAPGLLGSPGDTMGLSIGATSTTPAFKMSVAITELPPAAPAQ